MANERYLTPINDWATAHHTLFRSQTYGIPAVSLSSNRLVALPEGEGYGWDDFSYTRIATSASHLYNRPVTSSETWTWLDSPAFRANPLDMKAEADRFFLQGVTQLIGHGWPYTAPGVAEPGWSFYAAAVFNDHNPWWFAMPDVTKYLQRVSYLLRQGKPANDIAVLLPNDDIYSEFKPGLDLKPSDPSLSDNLPKRVTGALTKQIETAGYNFDYIDAEAIKLLGIRYPVLVMPHIDRLSPQTLKAIAEYVKQGGNVIAVGSAPTRSPGYLQAEAMTAEVAKLSHSLFAGPNARMVPNDTDLGHALRQALTPDLKLAQDPTGIGFIHRKLDDADIYFVVNSTNHPAHTSAVFRAQRAAASLWDPFSGELRALDPGPVALDLAPYESRIVVLSDKQ